MGKEAETTREFRWPGAGHCGPGGGQRIDRGPPLDMARGYLTTDYTDGGWAPSPASKTVGSHLSKFTFFWREWLPRSCCAAQAAFKPLSYFSRVLEWRGMPSHPVLGAP